MKASKWLSAIPCAWHPSIQKILTLLTALILIAGTAAGVDLKILKMGLGSGTVTSNPAGINCGGTCTFSFAAGTMVTLTATPAAGSTFLRWEGDASGMANTTTVTMNAAKFVRPVFGVSGGIPALAGFTPADIQAYLAANPAVNTPARFMAALPAAFKQGWILMTRSESLQTGTAEFPRVLLPSIDARFVFTIGVVPHVSYPGSHPNAIEYMQWDATEKNFRFHEIVLDNIPAMGIFPARTRGISIDDTKCSKCHSTRNVLNLSAFPGTNGIPPGTVKVKNKPNWDAYDSWGGMMPFNRDRIYQGSLDAAAFRKLLNPWTWAANDGARAIMEQLELQPPGVPAEDVITRTNGGPNDGHINFAFDAAPPVLVEPAPTSSGVGQEVTINTNYSFTGAAGAGAATPVIRGGARVTLHAAGTPGAEEGRGVQLFDLLGGLDGNLNQQRITDELLDHHFATGNVPIDIRPLVLAISRGDVLGIDAPTNTVVSTVMGSPLTVNLAFFDSRNGMQINQLLADTRARTESLPRRKADIQKINVDRVGDVYLSTAAGGGANGQALQYGAATSQGVDATLARIRQEVFRRANDMGVPDNTVMGGIFVDRESYGYNTPRVALYRYFLEPLGVSVDKWSMSVRGRSRTYTFADVFSTYANVIEPALIASLTATPVPGLTNPNDPAQLVAAINTTMGSLPGAADVPKYTDVQRIFNKSCIECHGGLRYPPYENYGSFLDLSEDEAPPAGDERLTRSYNRALSYTTGDPATSLLYERITQLTEECPNGLMPCGGPALSKTDIETIRRWIVGARPYTVGDPHLRTVNGVDYDFQAAGEFVLLKGEGLEIQTRHTAVRTAGAVGPNAHTGLTSCVSLNTAVAVKLGSHRISYQPNINGRPDPQGLQLRVNGKVVTLSAGGIALPPGGRIMPTSAPGGIQIEGPGGTVIVITPGWWDHYQLWYMNVDARNVRASDGLMGAIAPGNWLPAMPDGSLLGARPAALGDRYKQLYGTFGNAWRVTDASSLFTYSPGTSTKTFTVDTWPCGESPESCNVIVDPGGAPPLASLPREKAEQLCADVANEVRRSHCIIDVMATGEEGFAKTYLAADIIDRNKLPKAPVLTFPKKFDTTDADFSFSWDPTTDEDGDPLTYKLYVWQVDETPDNNKATLVSGNGGGMKGGTGMSCALITAAVGIILLIVLYFLGLKKRRGLLFLVALLILVAVILAWLFCGKRGAQSYTVSGLKPGQAYFWKVIVEDGKGGVVESETRRFEVKK